MTSLSKPPQGSRSLRMRSFLLAAVLSCTYFSFCNLRYSTKILDAPDTSYDMPEAIPVHTVAYAITVTDCSTFSSSTYLDGAAVLAYSIHRHSKRHAFSSSRYDYRLVAFVHPDAANCTESLESIGYHVQIKPTPINVEDIRGPHKDYVDGAGCCGAKEFLKLYSYTLTDHPIVVHLDTDMLLMQHLDVLFDAMLEGTSSPARERLPVMWTSNSTELPERIEAFFTRDYNMMGPRKRHVNESAVQGGFLVIRPNVTQFEMYRQIILEGDYQVPFGWGASKGLQFGGHYGAPQIQGLCNYFFGHVRQGYAVELNRCRVNNMVDSPYVSEKGDYEGECRTRERECEDCREARLEDIMLTHFTLCGKPWWCQGHGEGLCRDIHNEWFAYRHEMEEKWAGEDGSYDTTVARMGKKWERQNDQKLFCQSGSYTPIRYPRQPSMQEN